MSVISTPGITANSYASNALFVSVCSSDPYKQDYTVVEAEQDRALITATQLFDDMYGDRYKGEIYDTDYALYWPRTGVTDPRTGLEITVYTAYPDDLARATALQAYHIDKNDRQIESADQSSAVKRQKLEGVGEVEYSSTTEQKQANYRSVIHHEVSRIMAKWVDGGISPYSAVMTRG